MLNEMMRTIDGIFAKLFEGALIEFQLKDGGVLVFVYRDTGTYTLVEPLKGPTYFNAGEARAFLTGALISVESHKIYSKEEALAKIKNIPK